MLYKDSWREKKGNALIEMGIDILGEQCKWEYMSVCVWCARMRRLIQ